MLALYKGSVEFMLSQDRLLGADRSNKLASQLARAKHFASNLPSMDKDLNDAQACMAELSKDTPAFTEDQRKAMAEAITAFMDSEAGTSADCKIQNHAYLHEYMPDGLWKKLRDKTMRWDDKKEAFVDFALEVIGLRHPNNDTVKLMLAILWLCHESVLTPDDAYLELKNLGDKFVNKRALVSGRVLMRDYTRDVSQFIRLYPHQYLECDPPIASQLDDRKLQQKMRKDVMPSRSTNKLLKHTHQQAAAPSNDLHGALFQFLLGGRAPPIEPPMRARTMLALGDAAHSDPAPEAPKAPMAQPLALPPIPPASREGQAASADAFGTTVETIVNEAKEVIARNKKQAKALKAMKKEKAPMNAMKKKKHKTDDEVEDNEEDEGEEDAGDDIKKKPASGMKRPAAAIAQKTFWQSTQTRF